MMLLTQASEGPGLETQTPWLLFPGINKPARTCLCFWKCPALHRARSVVHIIDILPGSKVFRDALHQLCLTVLNNDREDLSSVESFPYDLIAGNIDGKCFSKMKLNEEATRQTWIEGQSTRQLSRRLQKARGVRTEEGWFRLKQVKGSRLCHVRSWGGESL